MHYSEMKLMPELPGKTTEVQNAHLACAGDLDGALRAGAALHEVAAAAGLVHQREAVERTHHAPIARVYNPLR